MNTKIEQLKHQIAHASPEQKPALLEQLLILQTPRAALAQAQMDVHPGGYRNRDKRLYELIDFNDAFVDCVLAQPEDKLPDFVPRIKALMTEFCSRQKTPMFNDEQFEAITRGLAREIAVYEGAKRQGLGAHMTSRVEDAAGIDMVITDYEAKRYINVDIKTPSAFRHRLEELEAQKRITTSQLLKADEEDYISIRSRNRYDEFQLILLCVRTERLGEAVNFRFENEPALGQQLRQIIAKEGIEVVK